MVKHMSDDGFTLMETLLVLSVLSILLAIFPLLRPAHGVVLQYQMQTMYQKLLYLQHEAITQKREIIVDFHGNSYTLDASYDTWGYGITCLDTSFHFTPFGNVSHAQTLYCRLGNSKRSIVVELGAGRMYVR